MEAKCEAKASSSTEKIFLLWPTMVMPYHFHHYGVYVCVHCSLMLALLTALYLLWLTVTVITSCSYNFFFNLKGDETFDQVELNWFKCKYCVLSPPLCTFYFLNCMADWNGFLLRACKIHKWDFKAVIGATSYFPMKRTVRAPGSHLAFHQMDTPNLTLRFPLLVWMAIWSPLMDSLVFKYW